MKKLLVILSALCALLLFAVSASAYTLGDVDGNGEVEVTDARYALRAAVGLETYAPDSEAFIAADTDFNGELEVADARNILRAAVGLGEVAAIRTSFTEVTLFPRSLAFCFIDYDRDVFGDLYYDYDNGAFDISPINGDIANGLMIIALPAENDLHITLWTEKRSDLSEKQIVVHTVNDDGEALINYASLPVPDFGALSGMYVTHIDFQIKEDGTCRGNFGYQFMEDAEVQPLLDMYAYWLQEMGYEYKETQEWDNGLDYETRFIFYSDDYGVEVTFAFCTDRSPYTSDLIAIRFEEK